MSKFSNLDWVKSNGFLALSEISKLLNSSEEEGRDSLIRLLEYRSHLSEYDEIIDALIQRAGLYPYLQKDSVLDTSDLLNLEYHKAEGLRDVYLHSAQAKVYRSVIDGVNVILSAPTSFGKSLLIDAIIASGGFKCIVVIVPTIALIDETRRRLSLNFSDKFKIITHASQERSEKEIFIFTQERFIELEEDIRPDFFVLDEFYKLSPNRGDERTFTLNQAFYKLFKSGAQFFLIGPNIQDIQVDENKLDFRFFKFDFSTVATEIRYSDSGSPIENAVDICKNVEEPTLIFCKSAKSAYVLAEEMVANGISFPSKESSEIADWLRANYHEDWILPKLLDHGFAVHHGALPRSIAYHLLRKFNLGAVRYLFCTSTIIEGVNTSAKNIIIYDNKIATKKFDNFTFNNIKGRAGRMFQHFVGHVYVLHPEPEPELPIVEIPAITQPADAPQSLLIQLESSDLSDSSKEQLRYLHAQDFLPIETIKENNGFDPSYQISLASEISSNLTKYHALLRWDNYPTYNQVYEVCRLIYVHLMNNAPKDLIRSHKQLGFQIIRLSKTGSISQLIQEEIKNTQFNKTPSDAVENTLKFLRNTCEFHFPRYLSALDRIQHSVFTKHGYKPGDYSVYTSLVKHLFMAAPVTVLEEYGLPYSVTLKILEKYELGDHVDDYIKAIKEVSIEEIELSPFEIETYLETVKNL